jgi:glycosyltransferase involved in cell wall biosynthesis
MKVAFITRSTLYTVKGGDTTQVIQTARHLGQLGVTVDIKLTHEKIDYSRYDLLHFFNIIRPSDILCHIQKSRKPFTLTTILIDYSEYDRQYRKGLPGFLLRGFSADKIEYLKTIGRFLKGNDKLMTLSYLWKGQKKCIEQILGEASLLFSNSTMEYKKLLQQYACSTNCITIPNGIDPGLFVFNENLQKDTRLVLCVGRIEGIKNQANLIRALNNTKYQLLIIGSPAPNQFSYYRECRNIAAPNVKFIEHLEQDELVQYYQKAGVHVLPSWFESCGLSSLEAGAMGCNIVATRKGYTHEYYEDYAFYCDPGSPASIFEAVENAAKAGFPKALRNKILSCYTWLQAATSIVKGYNLIHIYS